MGQFSKRLKAARDVMGLSQNDLALKVKVKQAAIAQYEAGKREPGGATLIRLAQVLAINPAYLIGIMPAALKNDAIIDGFADYLRRSNLTGKQIQALMNFAVDLDESNRSKPCS